MPFLGTLSANVLGLAILVAGILFLVARLRPADVGLRVRDLPAGVLYTLAVFASIQTFSTGGWFTGVLLVGFAFVARRRIVVEPFNGEE